MSQDYPNALTMPLYKFKDILQGDDIFFFNRRLYPTLNAQLNSLYALASRLKVRSKGQLSSDQLQVLLIKPEPAQEIINCYSRMGLTVANLIEDLEMAGLVVLSNELYKLSNNYTCILQVGPVPTPAPAPAPVTDPLATPLFKVEAKCFQYLDWELVDELNVKREALKKLAYCLSTRWSNFKSYELEAWMLDKDPARIILGFYKSLALPVRALVDDLIQVGLHQQALRVAQILDPNFTLPSAPAPAPVPAPAPALASAITTLNDDDDPIRPDDDEKPMPAFLLIARAKNGGDHQIVFTEGVKTEADAIKCLRSAAKKPKYSNCLLGVYGIAEEVSAAEEEILIDTGVATILEDQTEDNTDNGDKKMTEIVLKSEVTKAKSSKKIVIDGEVIGDSHFLHDIVIVGRDPSLDEKTACKVSVPSDNDVFESLDVAKEMMCMAIQRYPQRTFAVYVNTAKRKLIEKKVNVKTRANMTKVQDKK